MANYIKATPYDHDHENEVMPFAMTNFRNQNKKFGIKTDDRRKHVYVIGKTGMGKSTLLENMFLYDVLQGHGCCYVDPHGETAQKLLDFIPANRINDVVYFNPADTEHPIGFNIFEIRHEGQKHLVASGLMAVFKKIWEGVWSSRMEYILLNTILALLDAPGSTLLGINRMLSDEDYRKRVVSLIQDPVVKTFWVKEFASFSEKYRTEAVAPVQNKVGQFLSASIIRNIVAQVKSTMNLREIMDSRKILILNLSKGLVGEENSRLIGAMVITRMQLAAMERVDMPESERQDFFLYVDEFQNFATEAFATILSEARKYRLSLTVAHQYIEQLDETVQAAVFGNVGTMIAFRVGSPDALKLVTEFTPRFTEEDLVNLGKFEIYLKLMIDGTASEPFSAHTLPPIAQRTSNSDKVIKVSRERYSADRQKIEEKVLKWSGMGTADTGATIKTEEEEEEDRSKPKEGAASGTAAATGAVVAPSAVETAVVAAVSAEEVEPIDGGNGSPAPSAAAVAAVDLDEDEKAMEDRIKALQASSPNIPEAPRPAGKKQKPQFEIACSVCGKISKLNFEPDRTRPWYCKEHLEERQKGMTLSRPAVATPPSSKEMANRGGLSAVSTPAPVGLSALSQQPDGTAVRPASAAPRPEKPAAPRSTSVRNDRSDQRPRSGPTHQPRPTDRPSRTPDSSAQPVRPTPARPPQAARPVTATPPPLPNASRSAPHFSRQGADSRPATPLRPMPPPLSQAKPIVSGAAQAAPVSLASMFGKNLDQSAEPEIVEENDETGASDVQRNESDGPRPAGDGAVGLVDISGSGRPRPPARPDEPPTATDDSDEKTLKPGQVIKF